ncbi:NADPH:quinone oxidoreductase [Pseudoclavibacter sp. RFBJ3]|uniref:zinc-binding dehydrogenase n=1 Tax=unclassified Pseudoclavibacter TaxID=2615177 RepID=UPI000CE8E1AA|nr:MULTISPECIES: zinc-binding dehydrogenase [unclassified Pseudoclavibacter]PPF84930.1 NADPH:quinone oxidoreductase [Pseudoclavibacter sp. RFBJ5]PPF93934.1 NADPH:quinone oxidoreductase [Pseudoclavibacter sp. RFBJ3]PPF98651.1 NADPH:quinone oxidoreductase [Pseudoclavibacter sp. RFBH5]PPG24388.1 NADPH:quinone oxidoreductase [Pseudoclavibacter sp. RFBI4]
MRTITHSTFGEPQDVLTVEDHELPQPGPGEVRLRILLSTIHNHDLWTVRGTYGFEPELPARAGTEAVGIVDALGAGVDSLAVGQRVATGGSFGAWAEYVTTPAAGLVPVPDSVPDEAAAQLVAMPFSAISLLESLGLERGDWLVQNAANGAVGRMIAQLGAARGVNVVGLVRRDEGVEELREQGIERIVATSSEGWRDRVAEITGGAPIKVGIESVGGKSAGEVLSLLAENGELVVFGAMASPTLELSSGDVIFKQATVRGFWGSKVSQSIDAGLKQRLFGELLQHLGSGQLTVPVAEVFPFEKITDAVEASLTSGRVGKVLLRP